ncbi:MAG TPA: tyrosine-type recombinase/integrase, partial [Acidimicrobiales bacterium]|nr:tyrosine-type recombinase/integrase [Acidimicrobiales bacterium]
MVFESPCRGVSLPSERQHEEMHFLTPEQVNDLADAISDRYRALVYTAAYAGLRAGELVALKVDRVNTIAGTIEVRV